MNALPVFVTCSETTMSEPMAAIWERCWCWQYGRCLTDCPTAGIPHPNPMTDENWERAYRAVAEPALIGDVLAPADRVE